MPHGTLLATADQTAGRGRAGRGWEMPPGTAIAMSLLLRGAGTGGPGDAGGGRTGRGALATGAPSDASPPPLGPSWLPLLAGSAVIAALQPLFPAELGLRVGTKWPNDVHVRDEEDAQAGRPGLKLCGILCEIVDSGREGEAPAVVAGIGLNVNQRAGEYPEPLRPVATSLFLETGCRWSRRLLLGHLLAQLEELYRDWRGNGFAGVRREWIARSATLGRRVCLDQGPGRIEGEAWSLDRDGALLVRDDVGVVHRVDSGEIHGPSSADDT